MTSDGLHAASEQTRSWEQAVARAERGETVAVLAHGKHVADVAPQARSSGCARPSTSCPTTTCSTNSATAWTTFAADYRPSR